MYRTHTSRLVFATIIIAAIGLLSLYLTSREESKPASASKAFSAGFIIHDKPKLLADFTVDLPEGAKPISSFRGQNLIINFWATWCAPCRREMPQFDRLDELLSEQNMRVLAVSLDRGSREKADEFLDGLEVKSMLRGHDGDQQVARKIGLFGVPTTLLIDAQGYELGRYQGEAEWDSPEVITQIKSIFNQQP